jgi:GNAT superfamily N-acetyltransferase
METVRGDYTLSCAAADQQPERIHAFLTCCYWAEGIPLERVRRSIEGSLCFGVFHRGLQVGLARVVTDRATFAYLCDVYVLEEHRGQGLGEWLVESVLAHPELQGLRRIMLATRDAHGLYAKLGFKPLGRPAAFMEVSRHGLYGRGPGLVP